VLKNAREVFLKPSGVSATVIKEAKKLTDQAESDAIERPLQSS